MTSLGTTPDGAEPTAPAAVDDPVEPDPEQPDPEQHDPEQRHPTHAEESADHPAGADAPAGDAPAGDDRTAQDERRAGQPVERVPDHDLTGALEAVLLVLDNPASAADLATAVGHTPQRVTAELRALADRYTVGGSGIELREVGGGWRLWTRDRFAPIVERFILDGAQGRLSKAALESLAVVAYRQPVTRARVSAVRGVNVDGVFRTLTARGLIEEAGTDPDSSAILYRTTPLFLDRMGLSDLAELPSLGPLLPDAADLDAALDSDLDTV